MASLHPDPCRGALEPHGRVYALPSVANSHTGGHEHDIMAREERSDERSMISLQASIASIEKKNPGLGFFSR